MSSPVGACENHDNQLRPWEVDIQRERQLFAHASLKGSVRLPTQRRERDPLRLGGPAMDRADLSALLPRALPCHTGAPLGSRCIGTRETCRRPRRPHFHETRFSRWDGRGRVVALPEWLQPVDEDPGAVMR